MELEIKIPQTAIDNWKKSLENKLQVAAVKGWERAVELTPAAMEGPYATGYTRQSLRVQKTGDMEYTIFSPSGHSIFLEFGTGPKGEASGAVKDFPNDPQLQMRYHNGKVYVTRYKDIVFDEPVERETQGMYSQPFLRPALMYALEQLTRLLEA